MPLQKSFSDQNHSTNSKNIRQPWSKSRTHAGQFPGHSNVYSRPLQEKPPLPVSTSTRNKLNAFQFTGSGSKSMSNNGTDIISLVSSEEGQENRHLEQYKNSKTPIKKMSTALEGEGLSLPELNSKDVPITPAGRLALLDLIGMGDMNTSEQDVSPEERLEWDHNKDMIHSSASNYSGVRRVRKRARSSSPVSASPASISRRKFETQKTPVDPGSDLWGRFLHHESITNSAHAQQPPLHPSTLYTSSPQPIKESATPRSVAGFRRANSCGNQFPKRRRIGHPDDVFTDGPTAGPSKLSVLIEKVQEQLTQPSKTTTPSSSPRGAPKSVIHGSKVFEDEAHLLRDDSSNSVFALSKPHDVPSLQKSPQRTSGHNSSSSSDYGGDEMDETLLDVLDHTSSQPILHIDNSTSTSIPPQPSKHPVQPRTSLSRPVRSQTLRQSALDEVNDDEFDDSDVEMFAADMELLASKYDMPAEAQLRKDAVETQEQHTNAPEIKVPDIQIDDSNASEDEFGSDGLDESDLAAIEHSATQSIQQSASGLLPSTPKNQAIQRYLVTDVLDSEYTSTTGRICKEKAIHLQTEGKKDTARVVYLRGTWLETPVNAKAYVHVIGTFDILGRCVIDDDNNILILHPDHLISSTVVGDSFGCTRRAVLQDRVKATGEASAPMLYGTILHEIFQAALLANRWDIEWLTDMVQSIASNHLEDLYTIHLPIPDAVEYLMGKMTELQSWAELFVSAQPQHGAIVQAGNGVKANMCVSKLLDVEEHVWSPMYGLKGNIDATVQVTMQDGHEKRTLTVPFEVKTGKNPTPAHRAQTALYNLLISDRYDIEIAYGILYYMETSETIRIPSIRRELIHMIMQRNELACFVRERHAQLPPMLRKENMCNRCYAKVPCFIYHRLADDGTGETSGMKAKFDEIVKHLTPKHKEFFLKWDDLLTKEEKESMKFRRELWTMLSTEREKKGSCFSKVIIEPGSATEDRSNSKINRYRYNMIKQEASAEFSFLESQIVVGDPVVISDEQGHFALACGYVTNIRKARITVAVDRRLHNSRIRQPGFDEHDNQVFASIMEVTSEGAAVNASKDRIQADPITFRLDKDEFSNGMATARNNIIQIMSQGPFGSQKIRGLVVDLNAPREKLDPTAYVLKDRECLNIDQRRAIKKVMAAEDYALILGMPGTGKTTTIAHIIRAIVGQGKSVLLTSYTHSAVDNILLKLKNDNIPVLRLGTASKIHPDVQEFATLAVTPKSSFEDIRSAWHDTPVVGTTCLGINHPIFNERIFDYCIVDEASQITLPVCLGPIRLARTFILVGDHYQLPPLVQNEEARVGGLDISLFKHLSDNHPDSVVYLEHQYRMCEDVMALSNNLIYNGRLKCGSQAVARSSISMPDIDALRHHHSTPSTLTKSQKSICLGPVPGRCWLRDLLEPSNKVKFINTDTLLPLSREEAKGNRIVNPTEATLCIQLVESLLTVGIKAEDIGVMTHYRSQLSRLKDGLRHHSDVEMHTTDRFQGRDKEVIILSLVRSNEQHSIGELLKDWRRINVAFTRAKTKLLVIGSRETLLGNGPNANGEEEMVARFVKLMEEKQWIFNLPKSALEDHHFEEGLTQLTASIRSPCKQVKVAEDEHERPIKSFQGSLNFVRGIEEDKENASPGGALSSAHAGLGLKRQPMKKMFGNKPFKMPRMSVMKDVLNENS